MSGLLERIARRRRSAALRPGSSPGSPTPPLAGPPEANGRHHGYVPPRIGTPESPVEVVVAHDPVSADPVNGHALAASPASPDPLRPAALVSPTPAAAPAPAPAAAAAAAPSPAPAPTPPPSPAPPSAPAAGTLQASAAIPDPNAPEPVEAEPRGRREALRERRLMRRRARYLSALRELQLRDLGGFMLELHRFDRERPELVRAKLLGAAEVDAELRALEHALGTREPLGEIRAPGVGGACLVCGAVHGSSDRFCASCGSELTGEA